MGSVKWTAVLAFALFVLAMVDMVMGNYDDATVTALVGIGVAILSRSET